ncbi:hypothetical protein SELMODRAFT_417520 [Selaginella moellendorffii]|uniref:mRNA (guanine-N(7))-methyltransferase n=1 Tax=Selaginella moellendorffii TaxID=88036 RepID=D8S2H9_SELML|nr:hypothetical protein SELMODRAFT_417520 [Selaginella moellendorffii]
MRAKFVEYDCFSSRLPQDVTAEGPYDASSCQLAIHYAASNEATARTALYNISSSLKPGGWFVGTTGGFGQAKEGGQHDNEYDFALEGVVIDCPEYLVFFYAWEKLAREYGLELVMPANFQEFPGKHRLSGLTAAEAEVFPLYCVFAFQKLLCMSKNKKRKRN